MKSNRRRIETILVLGTTLLLASAGEALAQTATIDFSSQKQSIRGFGGMNHPIWAGDLTADQRTTAFGNGQGQLGMTILRIWISDNSNDWSRELPTAQRAIALGAIVFATPWNPPSSMTRTVNGQKEIDPAQYGAYATHLNSFVTYMKNNGVDLYAVGIQNEPDYAMDWTKWTQDEVHNFVLNNAGSIQTKVITAESFNYTKSYYDQILNDPNALANIDIVGTHLYGTPLSGFPYPLFDQKGAGKERWMTEHYTDSTTDADAWPNALGVAYEMHNAMVEAQFNAYVWWYIRRSYGMIKENGQISKRGYCFAQFSKFIRPGFVRVDATKNPTTDVYVSAYKSNTDAVIVVVNRSTSSKSLTLSTSGTNVSSYERFTTSQSKSLSDDGAVEASNGSLSVTLDAQSVTTLHGAGPGGGSTGGSSTGASSTGGTNTTGNATSTGGTASTGGATSTGGINSTGGSTGTGGTNSGLTEDAGTGGSSGTGSASGTASAGGVSSTGAGSGAVGSSGVNGSGGAVGTDAGAATTGGVGGSSRGTGAGGSTSGGLTTAGNAASIGGTTSSESTAGDADSGADGSCSCRMPGRFPSRESNTGSLAMLGLAVTFLVRRKRQTDRST